MFFIILKLTFKFDCFHILLEDHSHHQCRWLEGHYALKPVAACTVPVKHENKRILAMYEKGDKYKIVYLNDGLRGHQGKLVQFYNKTSARVSQKSCLPNSHGLPYKYWHENITFRF